MQRIEWLLLIFLVSASAQAQFAPLAVPSSEEAQQYYRRQQYAQAALLYQSAIARDTTDWQSTYRLAESLRHLFQYSEALVHYRRVYEQASETYPAAGFYYALLLKQEGQCSEALPLLEHFMATHPDHPLVEEARTTQQGCYQGDLLTIEPSSSTLHRLPPPYNTPAHDYAAVPYRHDSSLVLTSGRWHATHRRLDARYGENYTNLVWIEDGGEGAKNRSRAIARWNSNFHDGPGCFDALQTTFYFTRCQTEHCYLYVSKYRRGKWRSPTLLSASINVPGSNSKHPALSPGGDTLFFASDRPGGAGGFDLWLSVRDSAAAWQPAQHLDELINTAGDEIAPFYKGSEDLLLFATNGQSGPGGMDLYGVPRWKSGKSSPQPLRSPFNSEQDDCFLALGNGQGYLSSNRTGDFDIYQFTPDSTQSMVVQLLGSTGRLPQVTARPPKNDLLPDYDISVPTPLNDIVVVHSVPDEQLSNGASRFVLASDVSEIALSRLRNQQPAAARPAPTGVERTSPLVTISTDSISKDQRGEMRGTLLREIASGTGVVPRARIHLLDSTGTVAKITTTNEAGEFHFVNLNPAMRYGLVVGGSLRSSDSTFRLQGLRLTAYREATTTASYETLYFDFNQSLLRPEAEQALRELVHFFSLNPTTVIEINAFTDSLGNDAYNLQLSRQRGIAVVDFLVDQGVDPSALVLNAEGVSTAWSSTNPEVSQQLNRRVDIHLVGENLRYTPQAEIRILRPNATIKNLMRIDGIDLRHLEQLNGIAVDTLTPLKPLRIPRLRGSALGQFFFDINQQK